MSDEERILAVRVGNGANCSSVGSVVDTLFVSAAVGGALFAAFFAAMKREPVRVVGAPPRADAKTNETSDASAETSAEKDDAS